MVPDKYSKDRVVKQVSRVHTDGMKFDSVYLAVYFGRRTKWCVKCEIIGKSKKIC